MLPSFRESLEKLSFQLTPRGKQEVKAEHHFESQDPDWHRFVKNLKSKTFQDVVLQHPNADEKLRAYVTNFGGYLRSKDVVATVKSKDSGKTYRIKRVGDRLGCNCGDWQYVRSVRGGDCKHINSLSQSKTAVKIKEAFLQSLATTAAGLGYVRHQAKKNWRLGQQSAAFAKQKKEEEMQRFQGS